MLTAKQILLKYWGYPSFRKNQEEIINSILKGKDTLAILPTSGGKSICYQIPSLMIDGICLVVCPLISLMKDQVEDLRQKGIKAIAINSEMTYQELDISLTNCIFGNYKFLYISPEKLENKFIQKKILEMNINLIAIDEAHCISKWGHNFRPSYRNISLIRELLNEVPFLALTATATSKVAQDIQKNLGFQQSNLIQSSFIRKNISYIIINKKKKKEKLIEILNKINKSSIIYVNRRSDAEEIHKFLNQQNIQSSYYHAGINIKERNKRQLSWQLNEIRVMVATNAFGMGINKSNVETVIHLDIPSNIESYYQEVGRAGRNKKEAYGILLYNENDIQRLNIIKDSFPNKKEIQECYENLANHFHLAIHNGEGESFEFNILEFAKKYNLNKLKTKKIIEYLKKQDYVKLKYILNSKSKVQIKISNEELNRFLISNKYYNKFIKLLLRSYSGIFERSVNIHESTLAVRTKMKEEKIIKDLLKLEQLEILKYLQKKEYSQITYLQNRKDTKYLVINEEELIEMKKNETQQIDALINFCQNQTICRQKILLSYFGEESNYNCNKCDVCREKRKLLK